MRLSTRRIHAIAFAGAFAALITPGIANAADLSVQTAPSHLPDGSPVFVAPACAKSSPSGVSARLCLAAPTNRTYAPGPAQQVTATVSRLSRQAKRVRVCVRSIDYITGVQVASPQCQAFTLRRTSKARKPLLASFSVNADLQTAVQASVAVSNGKPLPRANYAGTPAVALPLNQQLPSSMTCSIGQKDTPVTDVARGVVIGTTTVCADGPTSASVLTGRMVVQLPAGSWDLRVCLRVSGPNNDTYRGDVCTAKDAVTLSRPGVAWMNTNPLTFNALSGQFPRASTFADILPTDDRGNDYASSDLQQNEVIIIPEPPNSGV